MNLLKIKSLKLGGGLVLAALSTLVLVLPVPSSVAQPFGYSIIDLGDLTANQGQASLPYAINNTGLIVGQAQGPNNLLGTCDYEAFLWQNGVMGNLNGKLFASAALGINSNGVAVGWAGFTDPTSQMLYFHPCLWQNGKIVDLLPGAQYSSQRTGCAINGSGKIVGSSYKYGVTWGWSFTPTESWPTNHAFLWTPDQPNGTNGTFQDLGILPSPFTNGNSDVSYAFAINNADQVVGYSSYKGFLWQAGTMYSLMAGSGSNAVQIDSAYAINDYGQIVGGTSSSPYLWTPNQPNGTEGTGIWLGPVGTNGPAQAAMTRTNLLIGAYGTPGNAMGINRDGWVVGWKQDYYRYYYPFLWVPDQPHGMTGTFYDLTTLAPTNGWTLAQAGAINDRGEIIGWGYTNGGSGGCGGTGFLLSPAPIGCGDPVILGNIVVTNGPPLTDIPVVLSGTQTATNSTDGEGNYVFSGLPNGNYTVTPISSSYDFIPSNAVINASSDCTNQANFVAKPRVELVALEVIQVIQDWSNSVPLIQGKDPTIVRAHLQLPGTNTTPVPISGALLYGMGPAGPLPGSPISPSVSEPDVMTNNAAAVRADPNSSIRFRLPPDWLTGSVSLRFECTNATVIFREPADAGGNAASNGVVSVSFVPSLVPRIRLISVDWVDASGTTNQFSEDELDGLRRRLLPIYPVADVESSYGRISFPGTNLPAITNVLAKLALMQRPSADSNRIYFGVIRDNYIPPTGLAGESPIGGWYGACYANLDPYGRNFAMLNLRRNTIAHEIGHSLGLQHDVDSSLFQSTVIGGVTYALGSCAEKGDYNTPSYPLFQPVAQFDKLKPAFGPMTNGQNAIIYGFDSGTFEASSPGVSFVVDPNEYFDIMSYCWEGSFDRWISSFTYNLMRTNIAAKFAGSTQSPRKVEPVPKGSGSVQPYLFVRGFLDLASDQGGFLPFVAFDLTQAPLGPATGDYVIELLNNTGSILQQIPFRPDELIDSVGATVPGLFTFPVGFDPAFKEIRLIHGTNILARTVASAHVPAVTLNFTNSGQVFTTGPIQLSWSGTDADGDPLVYVIQESPDGGATWETLVVDWPGQSYEIDSEFLAPTTNGLLQVIATDGFNSSVAAQSGVFAVLPRPPTVVVVSPANNAVFSGKQEIVFNALVSEPPDGVITNVQWTSSLDGPLGSGTAVYSQASVLSTGFHLITVTATDSAGLTNSASVQILVLRDPQPQISLQVSGTQAVISWDASVTNYVLETTTDLAHPNWVAITNVPAGLGLGQAVSVNSSNQTQFFRLRSH